MTVTDGMFLTTGAFVGSLLMLGAILLGYRRGRRPHEKDPLYAAARYASAVHLKRYGTLTHAVLKDALDLPDMTVERYLGMLEREGIVRRHGHGSKSFYTRT